MTKYTLIVGDNGKQYMLFPNGSKLPLAIPNRFSHLPKIPAVYLFTCLSTNEKYVGSTKSLRDRATSYLSLKKKPKHLTKEIAIDDFDISILADATGLTIKQRLRLEYKWMRKLRTIQPFGLNKRHPVTFKKIVMSWDRTVTLTNPVKIGRKYKKKKVVKPRYIKVKDRPGYVPAIKIKKVQEVKPVITIKLRKNGKRRAKRIKQSA